MPTSLRLLILEDEPLDAEIIAAMLEEAGYNCQWERVETQDEFLERLNAPAFDLILADYRLPAFDGLTALSLFNARNLNIPFIIVSGALGEELAIESLKAGATDYVLKQRLERLGPVVERALREKDERRRRRLAEDELRKLSQAVKQSPASIIITNGQGLIEYVNPKFTEVTGYRIDEVMGENPRILKGDRTTTEEYQRLWRTILAGEEWRGVFHNKKKDGTLFWESASISAVKDENNNITHYLAIKEDITERKQIEEQAQQQERLASIGRMAAGIAHDFNNILAVISLYSDLLAGESLSVDGRRQIQVISQQSKRAAELIQQILDFSRRAILERAPMEMAYLIKELMKLWRRTLPNNIHLSFDYGRDTYGLYADPTRMQQMLMNLIINARDAMPKGGDLIVRLKRHRAAACLQDDLPAAQVDEWVQLTVSDTGVGIAPEVIPHIYEPFFTTKAPGEGTGLGLAQVYGIVKQHDGCIDVESVVGQGTTFTICLPALSGSTDGESMMETELMMGNREMILVVEDDETTRRALLDSLDVLNYEAVVAANGREALAILDERSADIALILCDQTMPEMDGEALLTTLKAQKSVIPFILVSSYLSETDMNRLRRMGMANWLAKPLKLQRLADTLAQALAGG